MIIIKQVVAITEKGNSYHKMVITITKEIKYYKKSIKIIKYIVAQQL